MRQLFGILNEDGTEIANVVMSTTDELDSFNLKYIQGDVAIGDKIEDGKIIKPEVEYEPPVILWDDESLFNPEITDDMIAEILASIPE